MSYRRISLLLVAVLCLAAVSLYFFVFREDDTAPQGPAQGNSAQVTPVFNQLLDKALTAYNRNDAKAFVALFAQDARPAPTVANFNALFDGVYRDEFGKYKGGHIISGESMPDPDYGQLAYEATFEKRKKVKISANFARQNGETKLMQLRFEKM